MAELPSILLPRRTEHRGGRMLLAGPGSVTQVLAAALPPEGHVPGIRDDGVAVTGGGKAGPFYGVQTLLEPVPPWATARARCSRCVRAGRVDGNP